MTTTSSTANTTMVSDAINGSHLKVSYKMKQALLKLAKSKTAPIESVEFGVEPIEGNRHGKGYADYADVFYKFVTKNHHTTVAFDGTTTD